MTNANPRISQAAKILATAAVMALVPSAFAATTWDMQSTCTTQTVDGVITQTSDYTQDSSGKRLTGYKVSNVGNTLTCGNGVTGAASDKQSLLSVSAFSTASYTNNTLGAGSTFATASARLYSGNGVGVVNKYEDANSPTHTADNQNGTDMLLLNFGSTKFNLSNITVGWWASDYDITVLAYTGTGAPTIDGKTLASDFTTGNGWTSIRSYGSAGSTSATNTGGTGNDDKSLATNDSTTYSSWWIISAYNANYTGANSTATDTITDFIKIASVAGTAQTTTPSKVPEPGSLALMGTALMGFVAVRRRKQKQQDAA